jgi:NIPSNAP
MALYELRTYTLYVGKMAEATKLYQELGFPALKKGGHDKKLVGYFQADTGTINQLVHLWKFDDDADRRKHWAGVFANKDFVEGFASKFRPLVMTRRCRRFAAGTGSGVISAQDLRPRTCGAPRAHAHEHYGAWSMAQSGRFVDRYSPAPTRCRRSSSL